MPCPNRCVLSEVSDQRRGKLVGLKPFRMSLGRRPPDRGFAIERSAEDGHEEPCEHNERAGYL